MSLVTCSKVFRPWLSLFRPAADPSRLNRCRLFSSLQKPSTFVSGRLFSRHQSKGNPQGESGWPISDNGLVVLGFSSLGSTLLFAVLSGLLDPEGVRSKVPGGSRKRAEDEDED